MSQKSIFYGNMNGLADKINVKSNQTSKSTVVGLNTKAESINPLVPQTSKTITPTNAQQTITPDNGYNGITNATVEAVVTNLSASIVKSGEVVKIGTTSDDDSVLTLTGEYGGTNPTYLLNDEDSVSTFYFNTESDPDSFLSNLTYDPNTGACSFGVGYFYAVDLNSISPEYYGEYAIVWNDGTVVPIYSTVAVPSFGITSAGWQVTSYTPSSSVTISMASMLPAFKSIVNYVVAQEEITFGIKRESISVSSNGLYVPTNGIVYNSVSVNVAGDQPQLNAPSSVSFSQMTLSITDNTSNGGFTVGFKVFANGVEIPNSTSGIPYTVAKSGTTTTYDMSSYTDSSYPVPVVVKSVGTKFSDSNASSTVYFYKYYTVRMYDDDQTTLLQTQSVRYGLMPTYIPAKSGYEFMEWVDSNGDTVTSIVADTDLYAVWEQITEFRYKNSYEFQRYSDADGYYDTKYTTGCKVSPNGKYVVFWGGSNNTSKYGSCTFVNLDTGVSTQINYDGLRETGYSRQVWNGIFSSDSTKFYFWYGSNSRVYICIMDTSNLSKTIPSATYASLLNPIYGPICISPNGNIAASYYSGKLYIHNLTNYSYTTYSSASSCYGIKYSDDGNYIYVWSSAGLYVHYVNEGYSYERVGTFSPGYSFDMNDNKYIRYGSQYFGQLVDSTVQRLKSNLPTPYSGASGYSGVAFSQKSSYSIETYNNATTPVLFYQINSAYSQMTTPELPEGETGWAISGYAKTCMSDEGNTAVVFLYGVQALSTKIYVYTK